VPPSHTNNLLLGTLDLREVVLVGHSTEGGEVTHYIGQHGSSRVAKAVLVTTFTSQRETWVVNRFFPDPLLQRTYDLPKTLDELFGKKR
jgi:pimeloyl-ACP methyl ester carboxylesterase